MTETRRTGSSFTPAGTLAKAATAALLPFFCASCSFGDGSALQSLSKIVKERVTSALGAGIDEIGEKGSATVNVGESEFTVSLAGKPSTYVPPTPPGGTIIFKAEGINDITFQMTARRGVNEVEKFYRAAFARQGLSEKQTLNTGGLFRGEWTKPDGKTFAYVFAHDENGGTSKLAVTVVKQ